MPHNRGKQLSHTFRPEQIQCKGSIRAVQKDLENCAERSGRSLKRTAPRLFIVKHSSILLEGFSRKFPVNSKTSWHRYQISGFIGGDLL